MEYLLLFVVLGLFLLLITVREALQAKKAEKKFIESLYHYGEQKPQKDYSLERYAKIGSFYIRHCEAGQVDDITWNDLSMDEIFKRMDYTLSASGEEYLYYTLRNTKRTKEELEHLEEVVAFFAEHDDERVKLQYRMKKLGYTGKYSLYDYMEHLDLLGKRSNLKSVLLNLLMLAFIVLIFVNTSVALTGLAVLVSYNIIMYFREKKEIEPYVISFAYVNRLLGVCEELLKLPIPVLDKEWKDMKHHLKEVSGVQRGSFWVFSANTGMTSGNPLDIIMDYVRMIFHIDIMQFNKMLKQLRMHLKNVDALIQIVGFAETAVSIGLFRTSVEAYSIPEYVGEGLELKDAYHPLLESPVKNSITAKNGVLLTGSNASGKSTFLKTVAINAILAQTIHTCCATVYRAPFYEIYSSMALHDDLGSGESYYIVEIKALKRILDRAAQSGCAIMCFVDEVLRGTNTVERIAASTQILKSLAEREGMLCFAATHDIELTELLKTEYQNYHFEEEICEGDILFPYKLLQGAATTRNAIKLLELMGYDKGVIDRAMMQAEGFVVSGKWS